MQGLELFDGLDQTCRSEGGGESDSGLDGGEMTCEDQVEVTNWVVTADTKENLLE
jgi:hypothetical protein